MDAIEPAMAPSTQPAVSVIVPVYNDPSGLLETLESLVDQTHPSYEVIVVDNDSDDETLAVARSVADSHPEFVRVEREREIQSSYAARNTGIRAASGEILAFVDADVTVDADFLEAGVSAMRSRDAAYLGCRVDVALEERVIVGLYNAITGFPVERYVEENRFAPTCALFVRRDLVEDVGAFDNRLASGGDTEFGQRVAASGRDLHYAPDVRAEHPARATLRSLLRKRVRIGRGITQRASLYPDRYDAPPLWHPIGYLPPHPGRFRRSVAEPRDDLTASETVGLYCVAYLERLAETTGRALERLDELASTRESDGESNVTPSPIESRDY
ncbi:glycosyltransferase [Natrialbaceae archaeon GCM10025810]|uniref:glycosyltransferase n=1 Tax=Halovalidus salilacus TaxID=3075124 RepID=UPI003618D509